MARLERSAHYGLVGERSTHALVALTASSGARAGFKCVEALGRIIIRGAPTHPQML